ncbi:MAG: NTP transferase domain-containing protein [Anaerolineaceae bacterium]|nr:NTP transferase domain-containing protein [Anaerolineaceae bacterium]
MDAIILAGGKGTRMMPLTASTPKPLLLVQGRPILEWSLLSLPQQVDHVMVVVNYLKEQVADYMQQQRMISSYALVEQQPKPLGTGHAVLCCRPHLRSNEFLVLNGDDLYDSPSLSHLATQPIGILGASRNNASKWGVLVFSADKKLSRIHEKPPEGTYPDPVFVNAGAYKFNSRIFEYELPLSSRGEYEITDYMTYLAANAEVSVVEGKFWNPIGTPEDLQQAQSLDIKVWITPR